MFDQLVTAGTIPDFMLINYNTVRILKSKGIALDLSSLIKSNNVDVNRFTPRAIEYLKVYGDHNELLALPYFINVNAMSYNKDIFDKFGVAYPKDGMTWDQFTDLAEKVTRNADGVDYLGFNPNRPYTVAPQLSLDSIDAKTNKAAVNNDGWKKVFQLFQTIYSIPGNLPKNVDDMWQAKNTFYKNQNLAMNLLWWDQTVGSLQGQQDNNKVMNWDMVTAPVFAENPKMGQWLDQFDMAMSAQGKHQKETFQVINYLTSKEYQTELSKDGYITSLNDQSTKDTLGSNLPFLKGKNVGALFKLDYAKPLTPSQFNLNAIINPYYKGVIYDHKDINTTLRELDDKLNKAIQENQ
jgi:multiple sugar transport system substrate-binding protein